MTVINAVIKGKQPVIDTLPVTPSTSAQTITAPAGTDGYNPVNVAAVTSSIDANIVAGNIKKDVQILGVTGSYEGMTPTGTRNITSNGTYDVTNYANADVQVPTTAPTYYVEKMVQNGVLRHTGTSFINLNGVTNLGSWALDYAYALVNFPANTQLDLSGLTQLGEPGVTGGLGGTFRETRNIISVDLSGLITISAHSAAKGAFYESRDITSVNLSSLTTISGAYACQDMFYNCSGLTGTLNLSSLTTVSGQYGCQRMFYGCPGLTSADLSSLTIISGQYGCSNMFYNDSGLTSADLSSLAIISGQYGCDGMFYNCAGITSINVSSLAVVTANACMQGAFRGCTNLTEIKFSSLKDFNTGNTNSFLSQAFAQSGIQNIYFPAFTTTTPGTHKGELSNMVSSTSNVNIHFPKNLDPQTGDTTISDMQGYPNFGSLTSVLLFDLPSTKLLTGANTTVYERNPKYDTATALAWRVQDTGTASSPVIDWTPFYTSGLTDPQVNDTIYSDSACTVAVTTISSIA